MIVCHPAHQLQRLEYLPLVIAVNTDAFKERRIILRWHLKSAVEPLASGPYIELRDSRIKVPILETAAENGGVLGGFPDLLEFA